MTGETEGYDIKALTLIHDNRVYRINFYAIELEGRLHCKEGPLGQAG